MDHKHFEFPENYTLARYIKDYAKTFTEWYQPVYLGEHAIHCTRFPDWKEMPEWKGHRGQTKWDNFISKHLPTIKDKVVWDIGCSSGVFSINLSKLGAKKVIGFDRSNSTIQPNNAALPRQDVVQQAYFVKNLYEHYYKEKYKNLTFEHMDITSFDFKKVDCDFFFAVTVLYHFGAARFEQIIADISARVPEVFLQANNGHNKQLVKISGLDFNAHLLTKYGYNVEIYEPQHIQPLLYGKK